MCGLCSAPQLPRDGARRGLSPGGFQKPSPGAASGFGGLGGWIGVLCFPQRCTVAERIPPEGHEAVLALGWTLGRHTATSVHVVCQRARPLEAPCLCAARSAFPARRPGALGGALSGVRTLRTFCRFSCVSPRRPEALARSRSWCW